jgi:quercetin dioxygenase-like cupin family protein
MAMKSIAVLAFSLSLAGGILVAQNDSVRSLMSKDLAGAPGKELSMITVEYSPGESTPAHTHHAQAMVYVLEGSIVMQAKGNEPVTLKPGQTWYEGPDDVHVVSRNASKSAPAKYLVFMVKDKGAPILTPVK